MKRLWSISLAVFFAAASPAADKVRALILTGESDLPYHDWRITTPFLRGVLTDTGRFDVKVEEQVRGVTAATLAGVDVLVLNYNGPRWGGETERAVESFLESGKGMIAVHGVSYGPFYGQDMTKRQVVGPAWEAYARMMGATWKVENVGHSARHVFPVKWIDLDHPVSRGLPPTFLANDELYHKIDLTPNAHVLAAAHSDPAEGGTGKDEPMVWTVPFGSGRVVHMTLGHDLEAMGQPGFVEAFARGAEWAATGAVTLPAGISAYPTPKAGALRVLVVTGGHPYPTDFYSLFEGYGDIRWSHAPTQAEAFRAGMEDRFDVVVFHDCYDTIGDKERAALQAYVESGKGVVSVHHAIVDYTSWPWWYEEVIGGKFFNNDLPGHPKSVYKEGVDVVARPAKGMSNHPVMRGVPPIAVHDEVYKGMWHSPRITVLMDTVHPQNDTPVVYLGPSAKWRSVYIQLGHEAETFHHPGYRRLVHNAILWAGGRE